MRSRYRTYFWPVVLIVIGLFAVLVDVNVIPADRLYRLADLWPLILIVIGLELLARRGLQGVAATVAAALILLVAAGGAVAYVSIGPAIPGGLHSVDVSDRIGNLNTATLNVDAGAANMTVQGNGSLGSELFRAHIEFSGRKPSVTLDRSTGDLRISQQGGFAIFENRRFVLDLQINPEVTWSIKVNSGAANDIFKLSAVKIASIEINGGASREDLTLGSPKGVVPITINGGALTVHVHRPGGTDVSAQVSGGAVSLTGDGHQASGIGSKRWQTDGYDTATDAYTVEVNGGACTVTIDTNVLSG
ncbi:MAG: DUF5668 domain-containing protein [Candidatus Dormibacteraeota bacterium]|nr:DUF5668 domain-containing protein [Candidatus Dormibacteraeota bacterium]